MTTHQKTLQTYPANVRFLLRISVISLIVLLAGCDKSSQKTDPVAEPIFAVVRAQVKALNRRDATAAVALMHPEAPGLAAIRARTEQITAAADLLYIMQNMTLDSATENEAKVRFTQVTQKVSGPEFRNNRVTGIHTLRKYRGEWRIYSSEAVRIEYLDK